MSFCAAISRAALHDNQRLLPTDGREWARRAVISRQSRLPGGTQFHPAIGQRHGKRRDFHSGDALAMADADFPRSRRRQIDDPAIDVGAAILNGDEGTFAGLKIGHFGCGAERERPARRIILLRIHLFAVGHFSAGKHMRVERRLTDTFFPGPVNRRLNLRREPFR